MTSDASWYAGRSTFVTGHSGFKGAWLSAWLAGAGSRVTGYGLVPDDRGPSLFTEAHIDGRLTSIIGDVRDAARLEEALATCEPEVVFHLAAQPLVRRSYREPAATYEINVMGTAHLLDAVRRVPSVRAVVVVTSDKCYENHERDRPYTEADPLGGHDPYSSSKACAELVTAAMRRSFFPSGPCRVASARAGNVIGGGDWSEDRLVPDVMIAAAAGRPATIRNPDAVRPWQHVLEPLRGYLALGRRLTDDGEHFAESWNFGPADAGLSVRDVVDQMRRCWERVSVVEAVDPSAPHEAGRLRLDITKSRTRLGWEPALDTEESVERTVSWYRSYYEDPACAPILVDEELADYERRTA